MKQYIIIRKAVLMEDEGREHVEKVFVTEAEANAWIAIQKDEYFKPHDYYITEVD